MDWNGLPGTIILGLSSLALISLLFWVGHAVLNYLGDDIPFGPPSSADNELAEPVGLALESRERLATQQELDDVNEIARRTDPLAVDELSKNMTVHAIIVFSYPQPEGNWNLWQPPQIP